MALISLRGWRFCASRCAGMTLSKSFMGGQRKAPRGGSPGGSTRMPRARVKCQYVLCRNSHVPVRIQSVPAGETVPLCGDAGNGRVPDDRWMDEQVFFGKLKGLDTSREVFEFLSSVEMMSDTMASAALQRISEVEVDDRGLKDSDVFRALCFQFEYESSKLSNTGLLSALQALIKLRVDPRGSLIAKLLSEGQERLGKGQLTTQNLCDFGEALLELEGPASVILEQILSHLQEKDIAKCGPSELVAVYRMLQRSAGEGKQYQDLLNRVNHVTLSVASQLSPRFLSTVLNSLVVLRQTQAVSLVIALCKHSVKHVPYFTDHELVSVLEAFLYFGHRQQVFTEALEMHIPKSLRAMRPEAISTVMKYCCQKRILSKPILDAVAEVLSSGADGFTTEQIAECLMPFGTLNYLPPSAPLLFGKLEGVLRTRFGQFRPHTLLNLLHSCVLVQRYPVNFLAKIFNPYFLQQLQGKGHYFCLFVTSQLTQLFLTATLECPFYEGPKLLPKYQVKFQPGSSLDVHLLNRVKTGLLYLLKKRIYFASEVSTPYFYTVDIEIKLDEEGFVLPAAQCEEVHRRLALCIDGQNRFCINSHHLLGEEAIKQRHLKLLGYEVVQIPFFEIETLNNCRKMAKYLCKKIFPHAYGLRC
uniref:FAST kinase domains 3 n=1 Tax=Nothoprocta perdicaria TaxID=30464 RepID=A0A8C7A3M6_NOTPE